VYYIVGIIIAVFAFFMGATQKAKGLSFWRYFLMSNVVLWAVFMMLLKALNGKI
jgi:hypothetical protein